MPEHSLRGLEGFSHVWLLPYFHLNTNKDFRPVIHPPRLKGKTIGVFASRSPHRPSPIGLSLAKLDKIEGSTLHLSGIDLVDGTPILDIKPYVPASDCLPKARSGWTTRLPKAEFSVAFTAQAAKAARQAGLRRLITSVLRHETRNPRDRSQLKPGKPLEILLHDYAVRFSVRGKRALVDRIVRAGA